MKLLAKTFKNKFKSIEVNFKVLECPLTGESYTKEEAMWCPECKVTVSPNVIIFQGKNVQTVLVKTHLYYIVSRTMLNFIHSI